MLEQHKANSSYTGISGVSWSAVLAGAAAAAALSLILLMLGAGLGLSSISPWSYNASVMGASAIAWLTFMQLAASGVGGYLAGRLRIKWSNLHDHEVYFRDTAHGFLAWAVASLMTVGLLASAAQNILSGASNIGAGAVTATANVANRIKSTPVDYFSDMLLRSDGSSIDVNSGARIEVSKILAADIVNGALSASDRDYLSKIVVKRAGLSQIDAEKRVDLVYDQLRKSMSDAKNAIKEAADKARKSAANSALWMFVALLIGAFVASLAATIGGRQRDKAHVSE
ncbi:hypothetical protein QN372_01955 [Undibacterium sp. RTI2.1]|uniref:hypothetical protein n=1 Tax=unclassified Undibacterium TaxID=2630295 RepID=UPI002AB5B4B9|nr:MULTISPECIES: hypothetical protein [unclassified Undibacterium]MDY7536832.1 hypothetical protein [Undibacterium sp. 5I1]MEB0029503.1 hypothetical protein [Undibacterium sp. RTI2.1]MEB0115689.1 hypothetical protein [Undibacterium sp. RTI2.2]MEB0231988.1 hypothetical protein [Undibacterium sp. 10I3]MEB0256714.1 hypothetical protein [Undibacterium sp. 5I1]